MATAHDRELARSQTHALDAPPFHLLDSPLEYFLADHLRHRALCSLLKTFVDAKSAVREDADLAIAFLTRDLPLHRADEENDLFPALRRRARPEDDLGGILAQLRADDRLTAPLADAIVAALSKLSGEGAVKLDRQDIEIMQAYAASEHRHIAIENAVVLAIAGVRLSRTDIKAISRGMKARRGVTG